MGYKEKELQSQYGKTHFSRNKEKYSAGLKRRRGERTKWFVSLKSQLKCEMCGEDHPACLDFHHSDAKEKFMGVAEMVSFAYSEERILQEIAKCNVWCANCHRKHHWIIFKETSVP